MIIIPGPDIPMTSSPVEISRAPLDDRIGEEDEGSSKPKVITRNLITTELRKKILERILIGKKQ